jgi:hypothetical protein
MVMDDTLGMPRQLEASDVAVLQGYEGTNDQFMELVDKLTGPSKLFADMEENIEASVRMGIPREEAVRDVLDAQVYLPREMRGTQREQNELVSWAVVMAPLKRDLLLKQLALADAELAAARKIAKTGKPIPASTRGKLETDRITTRTNGASTLVNVAQAKGLEVGKHGEIVTRSGPIGWLLGHMYGTPGAFAKPKGERIRTSDLPPGETIFTYDAAAAMLDPMNPESFDAMERYGFELPKSAGDIGNPAYIEKNLNRYSKYLAERYGVAPTIDTVSVSVRDKEGGIVTKEMNKQQLIGHIADTQSKLAELDRILGGAPGVAEVTEEAGGTEGLVGRPVGDFYTPKSEVNVFTPVIESKSAADQDITSFLTDVMDDTEDKLLLERLESELGLSPED